MTNPSEITDLIIQSATTLLTIIGVAVLITGIVTAGILIEWKLFPVSKPFDPEFSGLEEAYAKADNLVEDNVTFNPSNHE